MKNISLGEPLSKEQLLALAAGRSLSLRLGRDTLAKVKTARQTVADIAAGEAPVYGVNTGFGLLARERIQSEDLGCLQRNLLLSHAVGTGPNLPAEEVRLALLLRIQSVCQGHSGVRPELLRWLIKLFHSGWLPRVPEQGSVGACGDLAPLAHLALPVIGEGELMDEDGLCRPAAEVLPLIDLQPMTLAAKEGLALINGVQISNAVGLVAWARMCNLSVCADIAGALGVEALLGSHRPFDARVAAIRPHRGMKATSANLRKLLKASEVRKSHRHCDRVQDPYSFRCMPQVHGACKDALAYLESCLLVEANSATDNPLVFPQRGDTVSAGNFHGQPIAMAMDHGVNALCGWGNISERRIAILIDPAMSQLPAFLTPKPGLNSGLMIPQVVAAALCNENKVLSHPASSDTISTSADQEDHVSMAMNAARKLRQAAINVERILAIELFTAAQAHEFHKELRPGRGVAAVYDLIRRHVSPLDEDRFLAPDLDRLHQLLRDGEIRAAAENVVGSLVA
ncbi:MAG: histidine ammonia-lyase [Planctomycetota bacterium]|nr:MAG: histidine ammonia-lyase [Planctomycetota bacterium]